MELLIALPSIFLFILAEVLRRRREEEEKAHLDRNRRRGSVFAT
jgi:hypothetical protein